MAKPPKSPTPIDVEGLLQAELRRRGMSDEEIASATRKKKRRKALEFNAVRYPVHGRVPSTRGPSPAEVVTVEYAAGQLKLHPKTILRFIKEDRLRATRVGKSYRILRADLDAFSGVPAREEIAPAAAWVTSIVDVPDVGPELAKKWALQVPNALHSRPQGAASIRAEVIYDPERSHLKIVVMGAPGDTVDLLSLIRVWLDQLTA